MVMAMTMIMYDYYSYYLEENKNGQLGDHRTSCTLYKSRSMRRVSRNGKEMTNAVVVSVSQDGTDLSTLLEPDDNIHINSYFGSKRSTKSIARRIVEIKGKRSFSKVTVILDYFWLQKNYYDTNYKMEWLSRKMFKDERTMDGVCFQLIQAGVDEILLPFDKESSDLRSMISRYNSTRDKNILTIKEITKESNPL